MNIDKVYNELLIEMFRRVGLACTFEQIKEFAKQPDWFRIYPWTLEEQEDYRKWAYKHFKKRTRMTKVYCEKQIAWFLLAYGWRTV